MFTFNGRDAHRALTAARLHLPIKHTVGEILPEREKTEDDEADPALLRLPAPGLRGTWSRAYNLLTKLVSQIGWDELLKTRSAVFVMEEEYRMQKAQTEINAAVAGSSTGPAEVESMVSDGTTLAGHSRGHGSEADDDASIRGMRSAESKTDVTNANGDAATPSTGQAPKTGGHTATLSAASAGSMAIPTIRISTESTREARAKEEFEAAAKAYDEKRKSKESLVEPTTGGGQEVEVNGRGETVRMNGNGIQQPAAVQGAPDAEDKDEDVMSGLQTVEKEPFSFSNKRLCERWLDNLFMVLYEVCPRLAMF